MKSQETRANEIRARKYDCFYEDYKPKAWTRGQCAAFARGGVHMTRCKRKSGYGLEGLFCRQHERETE